MYIKISSLNINIIPWIKKILNHQRPYRKYWFNIVDDKKDLKIWWDSPFNTVRRGPRHYHKCMGICVILVVSQKYADDINDRFAVFLYFDRNYRTQIRQSPLLWAQPSAKILSAELGCYPPPHTVKKSMKNSVIYSGFQTTISEV
jgi:hypothetical protein